MRSSLLIIIALLLSIVSVSQPANRNKGKQIDRFDIKRFNEHKNYDSWEFTEYDGTEVMQQDMGDRYLETRLKPKSLFREYKYYHPNGVIKTTYLRFRSYGFIKGIIKKYDEKGNLISEENTDLPYKYTWENILLFANQNKIDLFDDEYTHIGRGFNEKKQRYGWGITWNTKKAVERPIRSIVLDGKTGKIVDERWLPYRRY